MKHSWKENSQEREVEYQWKKNKHWQSFRVWATKESKEIESGSETEFITAHYWGYAKVNEKTTNEYEVIHPTWKTYDVINYEIDVDFGKVYGNNFDFLTHNKPTSVTLAEGSEITIENKKKIEKQ